MWPKVLPRWPKVLPLLRPRQFKLPQKQRPARYLMWPYPSRQHHRRLQQLHKSLFQSLLHNKHRPNVGLLHLSNSLHSRGRKLLLRSSLRALEEEDLFRPRALQPEVPAHVVREGYGRVVLVPWVPVVLLDLQVQGPR